MGRPIKSLSNITIRKAKRRLRNRFDQILNAMGAPGGGSNEISHRFLRHSLLIAIDSFEDSTLTKIFQAIVDWHFSKNYNEDVLRTCKSLVAATLEVYKAAILNFLPIPLKCHYTFSLRDFSRVIRGTLLITPANLTSAEKLIKLWIHETYRVFHDRFVDEQDRQKFFGIVRESCQRNFRTKIENVLADLIQNDDKILRNDDLRNLFFGNFMSYEVDCKLYDEITNFNDLSQRLLNYLYEYNMLQRNKMQLVLFKFAIEHVSRVSRVLHQENGHILQVGIGGSGRKSAIKLATFMAGYSLFEIEVSKNYGINEWRENLKSLLLKAGIDGKPIVFLFSDTQILLETFTEDINMLLNTGDVPNIFSSDEKIVILEKIQTIAKQMNKKIDSTPLALYTYFIERIKSNLHIALVMSPIGNSFRNRLRMFPSLVNCCTINWFLPWPEDALEKIAMTYLSTINIDIDKRLCVDLCKFFHVTIEKMAEKFYEEQKRKVYVTPTSYLELMENFKELYYMRLHKIEHLISRYENGLDKLDFAAEQINKMHQELSLLQPKLKVASEKTDKLMVRIEQDTIVVEKQKEIVANDEAVANEAAAVAQAIKDDCESDLAEAIPALEAALNALNTLKPADIVLVKAMKNPPSAVKLVMESICVMKCIKPDKKQDPTNPLNTIEDYWTASLKLLNDMKFLESLKNFDKDNISPIAIKKIRERYLNDREFDPNIVKNASAACEGLCKWVRAMEAYDRVIKIVAPKKQCLNAAQQELSIQMKLLNQKQIQLHEICGKLQKLNDEFAVESKNKKDLQDEINKCSLKISRATKIINDLGGEKSRWTELVIELKNSLKNVAGDMLLSAGVISYLGPFTVDYRQQIQFEWIDYCANRLKISCSDSFSFIQTLGEPIVLRSWNLDGLPSDSYSLTNGIIIQSSRRWPLMIDPQEQANKWIKKMEKKNNLVVIKLTDSNYVKSIEKAIQNGYPVLLENILETIDAILEPILDKNIFDEFGVNYIKLGENIIQYSDSFRFYMTTKLRNPHFLPEISTKVTLLNFMITPQGLEDQLLGIVVAKDRPDLEEQKNELIIQNTNNKKSLKEIEDKILKVLSAAEGNILEDETAIEILSSSKLLSEQIEEKQVIAFDTEQKIDLARNSYKAASKHASILFFCICDLANLDPMYQYSLIWFFNLYIQSINQSEKSDNLEIRLINFNRHFTQSIYRNVCRSLFVRDKLIFSLLLTVDILRSKGELDEQTWTFFINDCVSLASHSKSPYSEWLSEKSWNEILQASSLKNLRNLRISLERNGNEWKRIYDDLNPHKLTFPDPLNKISNLDKLIVLKCIRPDKIIPAVQDFIQSKMGKFFIEPPPFNLEQIYNDSNCCSPLIFILSAGNDPMAGLVRFSYEKTLSKMNLKTVSLGQGQGPIAEKLINDALKTGEWVVLQNCHLAESWMKELNRICDESITPENTNPNFRLWLTSYPSIKMTNEAPKGLKQNLLRLYTNDPITDQYFYDSTTKKKQWQSLLFSLCLFHGIVQERKQFGPLGWNIPYEFNESDLRISLTQLQMFLNDYDEIPFDAIIYLTGECNYGGRVTDDKDRRLLLSLLAIFYNANVFNDFQYKFSSSEFYYVPEDTSYSSLMEFIERLPSIQSPEIFGLHENADITKDNQETRMLLNGIISTQSKISSGTSGATNQNIVIEIAKGVLDKIPNTFNIDEINIKYPVIYENSMNTVLKQELIRFNRLISIIKRTLENVIKAIKGFVVMSAELDEISKSILVGRLPIAWSSKSYPSLKSFASYIVDLIDRLKFFQNWIDFGPPNVFWLSGFYFTQSFLTAIVQNFSRQNQVPIDMIQFDFEVTNQYDDFPTKPINGAYCKGLYLEGARWDILRNELEESYPKIIYDRIPIILFRPCRIIEFQKKFAFQCPVYKTSERRGILSTTGHSTNFVMFIDFLTSKPQSHWINRGVACLCQLND